MTTPSPSESPPDGTPSCEDWAYQQAYQQAILDETVWANPWVPDTIKAGLTERQADFLSYTGREALYGGAAGGGKSVALLIAGLQWIEEPGYHALILRRTFKQLAMSDSILAKAKDWLWGRVRYNGDDHTFTFPNGNTLQFGHMEHADSVRNYQGGAWAFVGVDEGSQFTEDMLAYPRTRQRRPAGSPIPIRWRAGSNPGDVGHEYLKRRYIKDQDGRPIDHPERRFFPATIDDNPNLDREEYIKQLKESGVDGLLLEQLLRGDWDAVAGGRFRREWFEGRGYDWRGDYCRLTAPGIVREAFKPHERVRFLTVDPAASAKNTADYTVISAWCVSPWADLVWLGCDRFRAEIPDIIPRIQKACQRWKASYVGIEAIGANSGVYQLACRVTNPTIPAYPINKGDRDKLVHATRGIVLASAGRVYLPKPGVDASFPREDVISELVRFTGDDKVDANDDIVDTLSYGAELMDGVPGQARPSAPRVLGGVR